MNFCLRVKDLLNRQLIGKYSLICGALIFQVFTLGNVSAADENTPSKPLFKSVFIDKIIAPKSSLKNHTRIINHRELKRIKGWDYAFESLIKAGLDSDFIYKLLSDKRMPNAKPVFFSVKPKEPRNLYSRRNNWKERKNAIKFYAENIKFFKQATEKYKVPASVILSILQIETRCGSYTGNSRVLPRLLRLASAASPKNIQKNYKSKVRHKRNLKLDDVRNRAKWLEKTFLPHAIATILLAKEHNIHPLELKGSKAGAFGLPQFLPGTYLVYGTDGDLDGKVDLYQPADAVFSVANYLKQHGWHENISSKEKKEKVIWKYNRSKPYIDTVLAMAEKLSPSVDR